MSDVPAFSAQGRVLVFVNEAAGAGYTRSKLTAVQRVLRSSGSPVEFLLPRTAAEFESQARNAAAEGAGLLIAMGGDGTVQILVNAVADRDVTVGIIPTGSGNDFARALGLRSDLERAASIAIHGLPRSVDLVRARTADGGCRLYCGGGGLGLDAETARYATRANHRLWRRARYLSSAIQALKSYTPLPVCAEFPESSLEPVQLKVLVAAVLNTPTYGAGLEFAPEAKIDDGLLDLALLEELSRAEIARVFYSWARGHKIRSNRFIRRKAQRVRLSAERPCSFHGDGEILGAAPVLLEVVPRAIRVMTVDRAE